MGHGGILNESLGAVKSPVECSLTFCSLEVWSVWERIVSVELFIKTQRITRRQSTCRPYAWKCVKKVAISVSVGLIRSAGCLGLNVCSVRRISHCDLHNHNFRIKLSSV
jgi:hypothetical protein